MKKTKINFSYPNISNINNIFNYHQNSISNINKLFDSQDSLSKVFDSHQNSISNINKLFDSQDSLSKVFDSHQNSISNINKLFDSQNNIFKIFENFHNVTSKIIQNNLPILDFSKIEENCIYNLNKYDWFLNSSMPASLFIKVSKAKNTRDMKNIFLEYFTSNNWKVLDKYLNSWSKNELFKKRIKILNDNLNIIKLAGNIKGVNIHNVVIPTLINQLEGLKHDYMLKLGYKKTIQNHYFDSDGKNISWNSAYKEALKNEDDFIQLSFKVFNDTLFQKEGSVGRIKNFSRHKISHGSTNYGSSETTIRCLMMIDFFNHLPTNFDKIDNS
jgi:hypothetical protein